MCNDDETEHTELWLHGTSDEDLDRHARPWSRSGPREAPATRGDRRTVALPRVRRRVALAVDRGDPHNDWFNWACLEKEDHMARPCFDEPEQKALSLAVSLADPRGADVGLEITRTSTGDVLVKFDNRESFTYYKYAGTTIEGSYTVVRFSHP